MLYLYYIPGELSSNVFINDLLGFDEETFEYAYEIVVKIYNVSLQIL